MQVGIWVSFCSSLFGICARQHGGWFSDYFQIILPLVCVWMLEPVSYHIIYLHGVWNMNMLPRWLLSYKMQQEGIQSSVYFDYTGTFTLKHCYQMCPSTNSPILGNKSASVSAHRQHLTLSYINSKLWLLSLAEDLDNEQARYGNGTRVWSYQYTHGWRGHKDASWRNMWPCTKWQHKWWERRYDLKGEWSGNIRNFDMFNVNMVRQSSLIKGISSDKEKKVFSVNIYFIHFTKKTVAATCRSLGLNNKCWRLYCKC